MYLVRTANRCSSEIYFTTDRRQTQLVGPERGLRVINGILSGLRRIGGVAAFLVLAVAPAHAQHPFSTSIAYDPAVPTPRAVLGYELGDRFTPHHLLMRYIERAAVASKRLRVDTLGRTFEGREIVVVVATSEANQSRLSEIKASAGRLADPRGASAADIDGLVARTPSIAWLGYTVHGNEASGTEAAIGAIYQLAAGTDAETRMILDSMVVLIDPVQNADGHERHAQDVSRARGSQGVPTTPGALIHSGTWPGPRTSHYYFDLNRDWFIQTHPDTRARAATIFTWWPHVAVDLHEMGANSTFYFAPPMEPVNKNVPTVILQWWDIMAKGIGAAFDKQGWSYFRREGYDEFYPGYGVSFPILTGAVGMTFEQASSSGGAIRRRDGTVLTLREAASHHYTAAWATLLTTTQLRTKRLRDYVGFRQSALQSTAPAVVFERDEHGRADSLAAVLLDNHIEVRRVDGAITLTGAAPFSDEPKAKVTLNGAYVVSMAQPNGRLANAILEQDAVLDSTFIALENENRRTGQQSRFYDVTGWSLPYAFRVRAFSTRTPPSGGSLVTRAMLAPTGNAPTSAQYAYAFEPGGEAATQFLARMLADSAKVYWAPKAFRIGDAQFSRGAFVIRVAANAANIHERVQAASRATGAHIVALPSAMVDVGTDLGSNSVIPVLPTRVAMLGGAPIGGNSFGFAWYQFDKRMRYPVTSIGVEAVTSGVLANFDVLVIPSTGAAGLDRALGDGGRERLSQWVRAGGVLVTLENATTWLAGEKLGLSRLRMRKEADTKTDSLSGAPLPVDVPGAILRALTDTLSPLLAGVRDADVPVLVDGDRVFAAPKDVRPGETVLRFAPRARLRLTGYLWPEAWDRLANTPYLWTETVGAGRVIGFAGDPNYRGQWRGLSLIFANAVLLGKSF